ncbi:MAG: hypothetical protein RQM95_03350 [Syntrophaceticus schinkii]|jgi:hypothetical protein
MMRLVIPCPLLLAGVERVLLSLDRLEQIEGFVRRAEEAAGKIEELTALAATYLYCLPHLFVA